MKNRTNDVETQIKCASALGHLAYKGNHRMHKKGSGQLKAIHFDFDEVPEEHVVLQRLGAISLGESPSRAQRSHAAQHWRTPDLAPCAPQSCRQC